MVMVPRKPRADLGAVARVLWAISSTPGRRSERVEGDLEGDHDYWFDGGALDYDTDFNRFTLADGTEAWLRSSSSVLMGGVRLPTGETVLFQQQQQEEAAAARAVAADDTVVPEPAPAALPPGSSCVACGQPIAEGATFKWTPTGPAHFGCA